ncbi:MAG: sigma 54-interacting transcriptional regulator [Vicinamibacterales bacterium]
MSARGAVLIVVAGPARGRVIALDQVATIGRDEGCALVQKRGRLELADKGSAFFDEIGELAPPLQAKLLRVLQQRDIERVGGIRPLPLNIRVIAATNRDLEAAVKQGAFRQDLFYRLNVVAVVVPPLRERREDLPLLITYFVRKYSTTCQRRIRGVTREARARLLAYEWPGNVRELENAIERAVVLGSGEWITLEDLPEHVLEEPASVPSDVGYHASVNAAKRQIIRDAVVRAGGNCAQAARVLQLQPTYLHRLLRNLGIKEHVQRSPSE